jgi:hypothetical protein
MFKVKICSYYKNGTCDFMEKSYLCSYAHGKSDIRIPLCRYNKYCSNPVCIFKHTEIVYSNIPNGMCGSYNKMFNLEDYIIDKKNKKRFIKPGNIITKDVIVNKTVDNIDKKELIDRTNNGINGINYNKIEIYGNNQESISNGISNNTSNGMEFTIENDKELNKHLEHVDFYYYNIVNKLKNKITIYKKEIKKYNNFIFNIKEEYTMLKEKNQKLILELNKNDDCSSNSINTEIVKPNNTPVQINDSNINNMSNANILNLDLDSNIILKKYKKWLNIYNIFNNCNFD